MNVCDSAEADVSRFVCDMSRARMTWDVVPLRRGCLANEDLHAVRQFVAGMGDDLLACLQSRQDLGFEVRQTELPREMLYLADEVFFVGTAVEVTPIRSIDKIPVGDGARGPVTTAVQRAFFEYVRGEVGTFVEGRSPSDWADAVLRVDEDTQGTSAAKIAASIGRAFSPQSVVAGYERAYRDAIVTAAREHGIVGRRRG